MAVNQKKNQSRDQRNRNISSAREYTKKRLEKAKVSAESDGSKLKKKRPISDNAV